jgi:hypothetical protein
MGIEAVLSNVKDVPSVGIQMFFDADLSDEEEQLLNTDGHRIVLGETNWRNKLLSYSALYDALTYDNTDVISVTPFYDMSVGTISMIDDVITDSSIDSDEIVVQSENTFIEFENGSRIKSITVNSSQTEKYRGHAPDHLYIDDVIAGGQSISQSTYEETLMPSIELSDGDVWISADYVNEDIVSTLASDGVLVQSV